MNRVAPMMAVVAAVAMVVSVGLGLFAPTVRSRARKLYGEADANIGLGRYAEAQAGIERLFPDPAQRDAEAWLRLGICRSMQEDFRGAAECFEAGLKRTPNEEKLLYNQALLYDRMKESEKAEAALKQLKNVAPHYPQVSYHLGRLAEDRGDLDAADAYYVEELNLNPAAQNAWARHMEIVRRRAPASVPASQAKKASTQ